MRAPTSAVLPLGILTVGAAAASVLGLALAGPERDPGWPGLEVPYVAFDRDAQPAYGLRFGDGTLVLDDGPGGELETLGSVAATRDSAIAVVGPGARLVELPGDGAPVAELSVGVVGIPIADPVGHLVVWSEHTTGDGLRLVAYNTASREVVETLDTGPDDRVWAVDRGDVYVAAHRGIRYWDPDDDTGLTDLPEWVDVDGPVVDVSAAAHRFTITDLDSTFVYGAHGEIVDEYDADLFGTFNADGTAIALVGPGGFVLADLEAEREVPLTFPAPLVATTFRWSPTGDLVVTTSPDNEDVDADVVYFACTVPDGECRRLGTGPRDLTTGIESSARGQLGAS